jgi:hypothetical protein
MVCVKQFMIDLVINSQNELCKLNLREKGKKECEPSWCYWHKTLEEELEKERIRHEVLVKQFEMAEKLQEEESQDISLPELPNTGSQHRKRDPSSKSLDYRPLNCGTS